MNLNQIRLFINLFWIPTALLIGAALIDHAADLFSEHPMLASLQWALTYGAAAALVAAAGFFAWGTWKLVRASRGMGEICHSCGSPVRYVGDGRFGPYYKCMACGTNRRSIQ